MGREGKRGRWIPWAVVAALAAAAWVASSRKTTPSSPQAATLVTHGPTGTVSIFEDAIVADFFTDDTVIRSADSECVARIRKLPEIRVPAGEIRVGHVQPDPPDAEPQRIAPDHNNQYAVFPHAPVFPVGGETELTIQTSGSAKVPAMAPARLHSTKESFIAVLSPAISDAGPLIVAVAKPLEVTWQVPAEHPSGRNRMVVALWFAVNFPTVSEIRCGFDLAGGRGVMPAALLQAVKGDATKPLEHVRLRVMAGDWTEFRDGGASYVVELGSFKNTSIGEVEATLE